MPMYVYQVIEADGSAGEIFEVLQSMSEPPLTVHPENGKPVQRLLSLPNTPRKFAGGERSGVLSDANLSRLGFTKYQKAGDGYYEKTAGEGPQVIRRGGTAAE